MEITTTNKDDEEIPVIDISEIEELEGYSCEIKLKEIT